MKTLFRLFKLLSNEVQSGLFFFFFLSFFFFSKEEGREGERKETETEKKKESKIGYGCSLPKHNFNFL